MAQLPDPEQTKQIKAQAEQELATKAAAQYAEGKTFQVDAGGHGPGVIPEASWIKYKQPKEGQ